MRIDHRDIGNVIGNLARHLSSISLRRMRVDDHCGRQCLKQVFPPDTSPECSRARTMKETPGMSMRLWLFKQFHPQYQFEKPDFDFNATLGMKRDIESAEGFDPYQSKWY
jgi:hypothetical protein